LRDGRPSVLGCLEVEDTASISSLLNGDRPGWEGGAPLKDAVNIRDGPPARSTSMCRTSRTNKISAERNIKPPTHLVKKKVPAVPDPPGQKKNPLTGRQRCLDHNQRRESREMEQRF